MKNNFLNKYFIIITTKLAFFIFNLLLFVVIVVEVVVVVVKTDWAIRQTEQYIHQRRRKINISSIISLLINNIYAY